MPAPHRRSRGESLAKKIEDHAAPRSIDDRRDRLRAQMRRANTKWEEAAARLSPAARRVAERASAEDKLETMLIESTQQNSASTFRGVLDQPCPAHAAKPGEPCWRLDASEPTATKRAVCGRRISGQGFRR